MKVMRTFTDQIGRTILVNHPPQRIISLVPSQTELLFDLGLDERIVGITKFCIHPRDKFKSTAKIGGTKKLNMQKIRDLNPDLIIGNKEENERLQVEELMKDFPVWMSDINVLDDALEMISTIGHLTGKDQQAEHIAMQIRSAFKLLIMPEKSWRAAYFIWKDPYMVAGRNTFIDDILKRAGFNNFSELGRYPEVTPNQINELQPQVILLSSEPYPFKVLHVKEMEAICPAAKVLVVDGEMFSWYGSRLLHTPSYVRSLQTRIFNLFK